MMAMIGLAGLYVKDQDGLPTRAVFALNPLENSGFDGGYGPDVSPETMVPDCGLADQSLRPLLPNCFSDPREMPRYALIGDSKAGVLISGLIRTSRPQGRWLMMGGNGPNGPVEPLLSEEKLYAPYRTASRLALETLANNASVTTVVVASAARTLLGRDASLMLEDLPASPF